MARRGGSGELIKWGIVIGGSYLVYTKARTGDLGAEPKKIADSIHDVLGKLGLSWGGKPIGGTPPSPGQTPLPKPAETKCDFISYQQSPANCRYVALQEGGQSYVMIWKGTGQSFANQTDAENAYNAKVASEGCY